MRRSLAAAALALATLVQPASAALEPWAVVEKVTDLFEECMDCFPQIMCVSHPACPVDSLIVIPPVP